MEKELRQREKMEKELRQREKMIEQIERYFGQLGPFNDWSIAQIMVLYDYVRTPKYLP